LRQYFLNLKNDQVDLPGLVHVRENLPKKGPVKAPVRLVKPEDTKASLEHPKETSNPRGAVASETNKNKK